MNALRRAEAFIRLQTPYAANRVRDNLLVSSNEIASINYDLAHDVEIPLVRLDQTIARSEVALAEYYNTKAREAQERSETSETSHYLQAAAAHLERAAAWTDSKMEAGVANTVRGTRYIADKLVGGVDWTAEEIGNGIDGVSKGIAAVAGWFTPRAVPEQEPNSESSSNGGSS